MNPQLLPANPRDEADGWERTLCAFLAEKEQRSGSRRTVEGYARMLWPFFGRVGSPEKVTPAHVLAWAHGIGASGRDMAELEAEEQAARQPAENGRLAPREVVDYWINPPSKKEVSTQ